MTMGVRPGIVGGAAAETLETTVTRRLDGIERAEQSAVLAREGARVVVSGQSVLYFRARTVE